MKKLAILFLMPFTLMAQEFKTPLQMKEYTEPSSYSELSSFVEELEHPYFQTEVIAKSVQGRNVYVVKCSKSEFGSDKSKLKVLIMAQQHGNEQSGKEAALLLLAELTKPENAYLFNRIDLAIIPQVNPDGSEINNRRNGNMADLNRNHLILEEPELIAIHQFFNKHLFDVSLDVHEYAPYFSDRWKAFGYRTNTDVLVGVNTNCNINMQLRSFAQQVFIPYFIDFVKKKNFSSSIYTPGGPPNIEYIRQSTYDVNDGRQSFGIQNTFSVIQEGLNGEDLFKDRLQQRSFSQKEGMRALLEFSYLNATEICNLVAQGRKQLQNAKAGEAVAIQMEHVKTSETLQLPVYSYRTGKDSMIVVSDYRSVVKAVYSVERPIGYLIPIKNTELINWCKRHQLVTKPAPSANGKRIEQLKIEKLKAIDFELDTVNIAEISVSKIKKLHKSDYLFIPLNQLKSNLIVSALEPESVLSLGTYAHYNLLFTPGSLYPILRVMRK